MDRDGDLNLVGENGPELFDKELGCGKRQNASLSGCARAIRD
jgi:hypothetical protein